VAFADGITPASTWETSVCRYSPYLDELWAICAAEGEVTLEREAPARRTDKDSPPLVFAEETHPEPVRTR
jgi:hypothetical protein